MDKEHADQLRKLEAQLRLRDETEACLRQALALAEEKLATREREILYLTARLDKLRRMKFGRSSKKRERQIAELEAGLKALEHDSDAHAGRVDNPAVPRLLRQTRTRKPFPESLPREVNRLLSVEKTCRIAGAR